MGITNLKQALQNKMGLWAGELNDREKKVAEILSLYESLPEHNAELKGFALFLTVQARSCARSIPLGHQRQ